MDKDNIIDNVEQYSAEELYLYIQQGVVTLPELKDTGRLDRNVRLQIEDLIQNGSEEEDWQNASIANTESSYRKYLQDYPEGIHRSEAWDRINLLETGQDPLEVEHPIAVPDEEWLNLDKNDIEALRAFIEQYPESQHRFEARRMINRLNAGSRLSGVERIKRIIMRTDPDELPSELERLISCGKATENDLLTVFSENHNILPVETVLDLDGIIDFQDLTYANINEAFIRQLEDYDMMQETNLDPNVSPLTEIPEGFTEIYFWGVPASGKTCAVGSIMSTMTNGVGVKAPIPHRSQGTGYMLPLAQSFKEGQVCSLPPRTRVEDTFEMGFSIFDEKGKEHKIAFIDLSGELFECMYLTRAGRSLTPKQQQAMGVLNNILVRNKSKNPKIHFFVIEYGSENNVYKGVSAQLLLQEALSFLDENNVLKDNTIGSYIIITKADKAGNDDIGAYVDTNFNGFYGGLSQLMNRYGINTRKGKSQVKRFPFSIGDVCFQKWCLYDPEWTSFIINEIKDRSYGIETGFWGGIKNKARK